MTATVRDNPRPRHLLRLQGLFVKLLFCERTRVAYLSSPQAVLAQYGLGPDYARVLPDPDSETFKVEAHGRRMRVWHEVFETFPETVKMLDKGVTSATPDRPVDFNAFLSSDAFVDPYRGLPTPDGSGPGYESVSKFFFWLRETCDTTAPGTFVPLRTVSNTEFGRYLITQSRDASDDYYVQFRVGIRWDETPGAGLPTFVITPDFRLGRMVDQAQYMPYAGYLDLDTVAPLDRQPEPNIR